MAKISYTSLKLKTDTSVKTIDFNNVKIDVLQYLPAEEKYDMLNITLQKSREGSIYNPLKKDMFFHLHLVYMYTNINFTEKQREDEAKLYDSLASSGLLTMILENIPEDEYDMLYTYLYELEETVITFKNTIGGVLQDVINNLPIKAEEMQNIVNNFDPAKFQNVLDFAKAANGGREV